MSLELPGIKEQIELAPYTTYKIGGPADLFVEAESTNELARAVKAARAAKIPYFVLGMGANILIGDKGVRGLVIRNLASKSDLKENFLTAESGATIADLIELTATNNLSGLEHFTGIPSSVGGALWQNLHFLSPDRKSTLFIGDILDTAKVLLSDDSEQAVGHEFFRFGYDDSVLHHQEVVVLSATFKLIGKSESEIRTQMRENLAWRKSKQPQLDEYASAGSVFKKIEGVGAGRLIDQCGLKGKVIGQAMISPKHANYFVNLGRATAADIKSLIEFAQQEVKTKTGYQLEPEITFVGEF